MTAAPTIFAAGRNRVLAARLSDVHPTASAIFGRSRRAGGGDPTPADLADPIDLTSRPYEAAAPPSTPIVDLRDSLPLADLVEDQGQDEKCVGEALTLANLIAAGCKGKRGSPDGLWTDALARERVRRGDALVNTGVQTVDAYDAACSTGILPRDARDDGPTGGVPAVNTFDEAIARRVLDPLMVQPLYDGDTAGLDNGLQRGCCATFTMGVTDAYGALAASAPVLLDTSTVAGNYHRQVIVGRVLYNGVLCYVVMNSWSKSFGDRGFAYIPCATAARFLLEPVVHNAGLVLS